jgi:hypothetical protein
MRGLLLVGAALFVLTGCGAPPAEPAPKAPKQEEAKKEPVVIPGPKATPGEAAQAQKLATEGTKIMNDPKLTPKEKYPKALELYRDALALDASNKEANKNKAMIEAIYKSMGRPVPGEES